MSDYLSYISKKNNITFTALRDDLKRRRDKDFFWPSGLQVYCGKQGSGKTISMVAHLFDMKSRFQKAIIVSNIKLFNMQGITYDNDIDLRRIVDAFHSGVCDASKQYIRFSDVDQLSIALVYVNNGFVGVIYCIDEIHTYYNSLASKNVPISTFAEISQQRKQRKVILGSSQRFTRMAKPFREQAEYLIMCKTFFGFITLQEAYNANELPEDFNGDLYGKKKRVGWFFHTRKLRNSFDTFQKIVSLNENPSEYQQTMQIMPPMTPSKKYKRIKL